MANQSKRHHFTPRYYLKKFQNRDGKLWRMDVETGKIVCGDHNSFGLKRHWNTLARPPSGFDPDWAEKQISRVDGFASRSLEKLCDGDFSADMKALAYAISLMQHHQPRLKRELVENHPERVGKWPDDWFLIVGLKTALREAKQYIPVEYGILKIPSSMPTFRFLTSSNPLVSFSNKPTMFFPISSKLCLLIATKDGAGFGQPKFYQCSEQEVHGINGLIVKNAWQYIYSSTVEFDRGN